jgi:hypothetical protein
MRIERVHQRLTTPAVSRRHRALDDPLMTQVDSVEISKGHRGSVKSLIDLFANAKNFHALYLCAEHLFVKRSRIMQVSEKRSSSSPQLPIARLFRTSQL